MKDSHYSLAELKKVLTEIFIAYGLEQGAQVSADIIVEAEACGVASHGMQTLKGHWSRLKNKQYALNSDISTIQQTPAFAALDGGNSIGYYSAMATMELAISKARTSGIYTVFSRNNNTFGPGFYYVKKAAENGMVGIIMSNTPASMAPWNGIDSLLGTNPIAFGIPIPGEDPILFDMATSKVAKSKIKPYLDTGQAIPEGWALDSNGHPTTDPLEAVKGSMLPMGEHKGSGLAMMLDILSGVLSGAAFLNHVSRFYDSHNNGMNVGFCMIAINPGIVLGESYEATIRSYRRELLACRPAEGSSGVQLPGQRKFQNYRQALEKGLRIEKSLRTTLNQMLDDDGIPFKL